VLEKHPCTGRGDDTLGFNTFISVGRTRVNMSEIKFSANDKERIVAKIKTYFSAELDQDIGGFEAEFLMEFFAKEIGSYFYNQGLSDAAAMFTERAEETNYLIHELEKPCDYNA
jgi:uncharacterized protein (DUF2164 family)